MAVVVRGRLRVVLDPTVLVEALIEPGGDCGTLLARVSRREVELVADDTVLDLWSATLDDDEARELGGWSPRDGRRLVEALAVLAVHVSAEGDREPSSTDEVTVTADEDDSADRPFLALARRAGAILVTTDGETLALSGRWDVDLLRPETVIEVLEARAL